MRHVHMPPDPQASRHGAPPPHHDAKGTPTVPGRRQAPRPTAHPRPLVAQATRAIIALLLIGIPCAAETRALITQEQAIDAVRQLPVVQEFSAHAKGTVKFVATPPQPAGVAIWDIEVGQTEGDRFSTFEHFSVDAHTAKVPGAQIDMDSMPRPAGKDDAATTAGAAVQGGAAAATGATASAGTPAGSQGSETRTGAWRVFPGRSAPITSPDGHWRCWVEGWTTRPGSSEPVTALTTDAEVSHLLFRARLQVAPSGDGPARSIITVGPGSADDPDLYHDLRVIAWAPDSSLITCAYDQGAPQSEVGATHLLLAPLNGSARIVTNEHLRRICEAAGLALDPVWSWEIDFRGFDADGRFVMAFDESGDEGAAKRTGPRVFSLDPVKLTARPAK